MRHQSLMVKEGDQHQFHLGTLHAGNVYKLMGTPYSPDLAPLERGIFTVLQSLVNENGKVHQANGEYFEGGN